MFRKVDPASAKTMGKAVIRLAVIALALTAASPAWAQSTLILPQPWGYLVGYLVSVVGGWLVTALWLYLIRHTARLLPRKIFTWMEDPALTLLGDNPELIESAPVLSGAAGRPPPRQGATSKGVAPG
jgi:hypothetical protein